MMFKLLICTLSVASAFKVQPEAKPALSNALKLRGGLSLEQTSLVGVAYLGGFGVTLLANPEMFYGKDGLLPYFHSAVGPVGEFFGRAFGAMMTGMAAIHFLDGPQTSVIKAMAVASILLLPVMVNNIMDEGNFIKMMWVPQFVVHIAVCYLLGKGGELF